jgi:hypothetical protein
VSERFARTCWCCGFRRDRRLAHSTCRQDQCCSSPGLRPDSSPRLCPQHRGCERERSDRGASNAAFSRDFSIRSTIRSHDLSDSIIDRSVGGQDGPAGNSDEKRPKISPSVGLTDFSSVVETSRLRTNGAMCGRRMPPSAGAPLKLVLKPSTRPVIGSPPPNRQYAPKPRTIALGVSQTILMSHHSDQLAT